MTKRRGKKREERKEGGVGQTWKEEFGRWQAGKGAANGRKNEAEGG